MSVSQLRAPLARYAAPAAFLAAATIAALLIRAGLKAGEDAKPAATNPAVTGTVRSGNPVFYRVRAGDTLGAVAGRFDTSVDDLIALNPKVDPNALRIGQRLRVR